jgi:hypothetical protein
MFLSVYLYSVYNTIYLADNWCINNIIILYIYPLYYLNHEQEFDSSQFLVLATPLQSQTYTDHLQPANCGS